MKKITVLMSVAVLALLNTPLHAGKPLKVFILAGQSNMQGKANVSAIERLAMTEDGKQMHEDMGVEGGKPSAVEGVYGVFHSGDDKSKGEHRAATLKAGPLVPGLGDAELPNPSFGPEYTFGIYMHKHLDEPFLVIKTAWGGRDLLSQFRPPSVGSTFVKKGEEKSEDKHGNPVGHYYSLIVKRVQETLSDIDKYHPAYNKEDGYEIAGFVWFQGFNDLIRKDEYSEDYSEYTDLMSAFIRDVRKDLNAPDMPFIIGVMGMGGPKDDENDQQVRFRKAQAAPAQLAEFKGNVAAVETAPHWDMEIQRILDKINTEVEKKVLEKDPTLKKRALFKAVKSEKKAMIPEILSEHEMKLLDVGKTDQGYHYFGSAYAYGKIGKAFADELAKMLEQAE